MGGSSSKPAASPAPGGIESKRLNSKDLEEAIELTLNYGKKREANETFQVFGTTLRAWDSVLDALNSTERFREFTQGETGKAVTKRVLKALDADGDGRITPRDFQIIYDRNIQDIIVHNSSNLDRVLPFVGQCIFGYTVGSVSGRLARQLYRQKALILACGVSVYSGVQYLAQKNFVNQKMLEVAFKEKLKELADVNGDGEITREDLNALVENRMQFIATKLGPGGIAPGMTGYATLGLGLLRGLRRI